jgi:peptidyl-prolyl cis-trans isomerase A (cyclophilin A)
MRKLLAVVTLFSLASITAWSQDASTSQVTPAKPAAKPATHAASSEPTAVFDTTAGKLRCKLFEKETPITVKNFIDLATGAKD